MDNSILFYYLTVSSAVYRFSWLIAGLVAVMALYFIAQTVKQFARETAIDCIELYQRWETCKMDLTTRRTRLELASRYARFCLAENRKAIASGRPMLDLREAWNSGKFDILVEDFPAEAR